MSMHAHRVSVMTKDHEHTGAQNKNKQNVD